MRSQRNVHGKLFGGFVASHAFDLAYFAARYFVRGTPFVPLGLDEAVFVQPVAIGDMVRMSAAVVHCGDDGIFRVLVNAGVLHPDDPGRQPQRTNVLRFAFAAHPDGHRTVLPQTYQELLWHVDAARRHAVEAPTPAARRELDAFFAQ